MHSDGGDGVPQVRGLPNGAIGIGSSLSSVWAIAILVPTFAVAVRRLRDAGRGWKELFWLLVPIAGVIVITLRLCEPSKTVSPASGDTA